MNKFIIFILCIMTIVGVILEIQAKHKFGTGVGNEEVIVIKHYIIKD